MMKLEIMDGPKTSAAEQPSVTVIQVEQQFVPLIVHCFFQLYWVLSIISVIRSPFLLMYVFCSLLVLSFRSVYVIALAAVPCFFPIIILSLCVDKI